MMVIFAIDAGFTLPGYAFFDTVENKILECGAVPTARTPKLERKRKPFYVSHDDARRVCQIWAELDVKVKAYKPALMTAELPVGAGRSSSAVKGMAYATAVVVILAEVNGIVNRCYVTPEQNKLASAGIRDASKEQVMAGVERRFGPVWVQKRNGINHPVNWAIADALSTIMAYECL